MELNFELQIGGSHHLRHVIVASISKKDLKLSDRVFRCDCGYIEDRDFNAALNLRDATTYEVA